MYTLKLTTIGSSTGVIIPKAMLAELNVEKGDRLFVIKTPDGLMLTPYDPEIEKQLKIVRDFMKEYRDTFKILAE